MSMKLPRAVSELVPKLAGFRLAYERLVDPPAPINLTLSITNMCNSRCQSCDIWKIYPAEKDRLEEELSVEEIEKIFRSVGRVYFFNISGGEPFLRKDIVDIVRVGCEQLKPSVVHIPTNALSPQRIATLTEEILIGMRTWSPGTKLTLKPSFDGVGEFHDWVRGIPGNYKKLIHTLQLLRDLRERYDHLRVGVGTVISTMNIDRLPDIIAEGERFAVDTYISEVAEERDEMRNVGTGITPSHEAYGDAIQQFRDMTFDRLKEASGLELLTQGMRHHYYEITRRWLRDRKQVIGLRRPVALRDPRRLAQHGQPEGRRLRLLAPVALQPRRRGARLDQGRRVRLSPRQSGLRQHAPVAAGALQRRRHRRSRQARSR